MGLLDDAIKEHLDLKRRRGADPTEIERLEREALGPVRRVAQEPPPDEESGAELTHATGQALPPEELDHEADYEHDHEPAYEYVEDQEDEYASDEQSVSTDPGAYQAEPPMAEVPETHGIVPPPEPMPAEPPDHPGLGVETAEYDVEAEHGEGEGEGDEGDDMLEETPEFLQDAPDHDRLWFEQRPPKDFDFDG